MTPGLIERLEKAEGGSPHLDRLIAIHLRIGADKGEKLSVRRVSSIKSPYELEVTDDDSCYWVESPSRRARLLSAEPFTLSLDAALALADLVYPDGWLDLTISNRTARASQCFEGNRAYHGPRHASPAIAVCIAILKARATQEQTHG